MMNTIAPTRNTTSPYTQNFEDNPGMRNIAISPLTPGEIRRFERGAGEPFLPDVVRNSHTLPDRISDREVFLKQIFGNDYERVSTSFTRIVLPVVPAEYVLVGTEEDGKTEKILGKGGFGVVLEGTLMFPRGQMKNVVLKENFDRSDQESILEEARICMFLERTGFVPTCYGLIQTDSGVLRMIQECFGNGTTLQKIFKDRLLQKSHHILLLDIACQLAEGLSRIHSMHVLLNDLKSDNILVDLKHSRPNIRFCDFGLSSYKEGICYVNVNRLSSPHIAPEHTGESNLPTTPANDVFGLGRILKRIYMITKYKQLVSLVESTYHYDPNMRCSAMDALQYMQVALLDAIQLEQIELRKKARSKTNKPRAMVATGGPVYGPRMRASKPNQSDVDLDTGSLENKGTGSNSRKGTAPSKGETCQTNNSEAALTPFVDAKERLSASPQADVTSASSADGTSQSTGCETPTSGALEKANHYVQSASAGHAHSKSPVDVLQAPIPSIPLSKMADIRSEVASHVVGCLAGSLKKDDDSTKEHVKLSPSCMGMGDVLYDVILHGLILAFVTVLAMAWVKD